MERADSLVHQHIPTQESTWYLSIRKVFFCTVHYELADFLGKDFVCRAYKYNRMTDLTQMKSNKYSLEG